MKKLRLLSIILILLGIGLYFFGNYVQGEVNQGYQQISSAQKNVDQIEKFSDVSPYSKGVGDMVTGSAQKKIDAGRQEAAHYQMVANWLHGSGLTLIIAGLVLLVISFFSKRKS